MTKKPVFKKIPLEMMVVDLHIVCSKVPDDPHDIMDAAK